MQSWPPRAVLRSRRTDLRDQAFGSSSRSTLRELISGQQVAIEIGLRLRCRLIVDAMLAEAISAAIRRA